MTSKPAITTLGELKKSGYQPLSVKDELRKNLIQKIESEQPVFEGIIGYEETVIPEIQTAILSRHNILLLGLRGQAKTRIARTMTSLLDEWIPVIEGAELNDDPLFPISRYAKELTLEHGDNTPINWLHRDERYVEKLATPDVSVADLIGDLDAIKAASLKLPYSDERVIHFGLAPRAHRSIFVINELPDLQARIQVALFNLLQEKDVQIRGFKLRLPLDICMVFTANPEDYTNRGSIVTPLKDRIESQILTHYPKTIEVSRAITKQEARILPEQRAKIHVPDLIEELIEQIAFEARESEYIDHKSGVSARLTISAYENLVSFAERRILLNKEQNTVARIGDLYAIIPAITGKVELVYEGEQEGAFKVAYALIGKAIRSRLPVYFPEPEKTKRKKDEPNPYQKIINFFAKGYSIDLLRNIKNKDYERTLMAIDGLNETVKKYHPKLNAQDHLLFMEFLLNGLAEFSQISKTRLENGLGFKDMLGGILSSPSFKDIDLEDEDY
jgi:magnesium chelatase subunit I